MWFWLSFGQQIRQLREAKQISLNQFAKELGVSSAYLSNLENGKTETVQLSVLTKIQEKLMFSLEQSPINSVNTHRIQRLSKLLEQMSIDSPEKVNFLLQVFENGITSFTSEK